ncbi:chromosome segregation protein SMC [Candidatus Woesearchaeota archaeon]|nr:chromosome segregation protein SMC [Candidatus Woesearchaeota archaeon]
MTKINKIQISGFKSFANKTELLLGEKFNCVLGPNGSGKSNVLDAVCFVLGRLGSKSLRAEKSTNLIYNGGKKAKPAKQGEVHIFFDNKSKVFPFDDEEIKVSRIIKKTGQSKYKINGKTRTRNEVLDVLGRARIDPNGFNIILQGDIIRFCEMSSLERRKILEQISGIGVYEEKKHKATLELDKVDKKLNDAEIVMSERKQHLRELRKDRDYALRFQDLKNKISSNKATYLDMQIRKQSKDGADLSSQIKDFETKLKRIEDNIGNFRKDIGEKKNQLADINKEIEEKGEKEQVELNKESTDMRVELEKHKSRLNVAKDEIAKIKQRKDQLTEDISENTEKIKEFEKEKKEILLKKQAREKELAEVEKKIELFKKKNKIDEQAGIEREIDATEKEIEKKQEEIQKIVLEKQDSLREKDRLEIQIENIDQQVLKVKEIEKEHKQQINDLKSKREKFKKSTIELNKCLEADSSLAAQIAQARKKLVEQQEEQARLNARNIQAVERVAGDLALKKIIERKKSVKGIYGTVAELGKVKSKYSMALEVAAGPRVNSVVVENDKVAADCIKYLKENKFGIVTFIPLNKIKTPESRQEVRGLVKEDGVHDLALNLIDYDKRYEKAFAYVFGDTLIVEDIETARKIGIGRARMVSLDGDLADHSGVMRGGFRSKRAGSFVEKDVVDDIESLDKEIEKLKREVDVFEKKREENEKTIQTLRFDKHNLEGEVIKLEKSLHLDESDLDASKSQKENLKKSLEETNKKISGVQERTLLINKELAGLKTKKQQLRDKISSLRDPNLVAELSAFEESRQKIRDEIGDLNNKIEQIKGQIKLFSPEESRTYEIIKQHDKEEEDFKEEIKQLEVLIKKKEKDLKEMDQKITKFHSAYKGLFNKRDKVQNEIQARENRIDNLRDQSRRIEIDSNKVSLRRAEVNAKLSGLQKEYENYKDAKILRGRTEEDLKKEINKFEGMVATMTAVNLKALEIYDEVEREYTKLLDKKEILIVEKKKVEELMNEIEGKKKDQFMVKFKEVNDHFQKFFVTLSRKGSAYLEIENPEKPFEEGVNIRVRLTGQRYLDIKSLSGGEKTMTALAFIFAIQEHEPHSFYILDEVDAALDKHNSEKLAKLVREYADKAQYLIISHNDAVISEADNLYGVSMDEHGVTKVMSLKI